MKSLSFQRAGLCGMLALSLAISSGCVGKLKEFAGKPKAATAVARADRPPSGPTKVKVDGPALALGLPEQGGEPRQKFLEQLGKLQNENRLGAARLWVERHPDIALEVLRDPASAQISDSLLLVLAQYHDEHLETTSTPGSWHACLTARQGQAAARAAFAKSHTQVTEHLRNGRFFEASEVPLPAQAAKLNQPMLAIEAAQLHGVAKMLADKPAEAAASLESAVRLAAEVSPHQSAHAMLLLSEARRRGGDISGANQAWLDSVTQAGQLLGRPRPVADPTLWDRAMYLHPVGISLPLETQHGFAQLASNRQLPLALQPVAQITLCNGTSDPERTAEAAIWACIGNWRMDRGEPQAAMLALKRSEATAGSTDAAAWCRLAQARALVALGQTPAATAILIPLASQENGGALTSAAMAELGSLKVSGGMTQQGVNLLKKALEGNAALDWPDRPSAEADLGLALLLTGDETRGLAWLMQARQGFEAQGDRESVAQTLWNEARYFEEKKDKKRMAELDKKYQELQF